MKTKNNTHEDTSTRTTQLFGSALWRPEKKTDNRFALESDLREWPLADVSFSCVDLQDANRLRDHVRKCAIASAKLELRDGGVGRLVYTLLDGTTGEVTTQDGPGPVLPPLDDLGALLGFDQTKHNNLLQQMDRMIEKSEPDRGGIDR